MVDFTKPVNNADMVKELNALIRCNMELRSYYTEDLTPRLEDQAFQQPVASLNALHSHHAELIGDTVRYLVARRICQWGSMRLLAVAGCACSRARESWMIL